MAVPSSFTEIRTTSLQATKTYTYYLGYAWSGNTATLDGTTLKEKAGVVEITDQGQVHTLIVDGQVFTEAIEIKILDKHAYLPVILSN